MTITVNFSKKALVNTVVGAKNGINNVTKKACRGVGYAAGKTVAFVEDHHPSLQSLRDGYVLGNKEGRL